MSFLRLSVVPVRWCLDGWAGLPPQRPAMVAKALGEFPLSLAAFVRDCRCVRHCCGVPLLAFGFGCCHDFSPVCVGRPWPVAPVTLFRYWPKTGVVLFLGLYYKPLLIPPLFS